MRALVLALIATAGCFSGPGTGDDICPATAIATQGLRDPSNGTCEGFGGGCRGIADPDWAVCGGACEAKGEADCRGTAGCRAIYTGRVCPPNADCSFTTQVAFFGCWGTAPYSHIEGGDCWGLDPYTCSEHDDCSAVFATQPAQPPLSWASCMPELHPLDPGTCDGLVVCRAAPPACPTGTVPGVTNGCYSGYCIPKNDCNGARDPGTCSGAACGSVGPACPAGTQPGVRNGCWSGYCIPNSACPP